MKQRERLIELIREAMKNHEITIENYVIPTSDYIADYILKNGVVVPPCKIGDTVYKITSKGICEIKIENIYCWCNEIWKCNGWSERNEYKIEHRFPFDDIGKTVFLTREEAEQALNKVTHTEKGR